MLIDLIIGIAASLIASLIVGFLGNKAVSKNNCVALKLYVCFLSIIVFVCCSIISIALNKDFGERVASITEVSLIYFYDSCMYVFMFIIAAIVIVTVFAGYLAYHDFSAKSERFHKQNLDQSIEHTK